jgi:hypothetical protein
LGGNGTTLAVASNFQALEPSRVITARLIPLAWTPLGIAVGNTHQDVGIPLGGLVDWIDRTFPPGDEHAFVVPMHDIELLARVGWNAPMPEHLDEASVINLEDLPEEIAEGLVHAPVTLVQCATCRRLCVRDDFIWKEKQLCAWDYHGQVFGKRGPWHDGAYEERHVSTLPVCAYVAPPLVTELKAHVVLTLDAPAETVDLQIINALLDGHPGRAHMAVRTAEGFAVLREA